MVRANRRRFLSEKDGTVLFVEFRLFCKRLYELCGELYGAAAVDAAHPTEYGPVVAEVNGLAGRLQAMINEFGRRLALNVEAELQEKDPASSGPAP